MERPVSSGAALRRFLLVGLTGGIATGKSTVSEMLRRRGCVLIDADVLAREVVEPGEPALQQIVAEFGADVLGPDGRLDRKKLGAIVFADPARRKTLEAITWIAWSSSRPTRPRSAPGSRRVTG